MTLSDSKLTINADEGVNRAANNVRRTAGSCIKLSDSEVRQIRAEYQIDKGSAVNVIELAQRFGISQQIVRDVARGRRYGMVE